MNGRPLLRDRVLLEEARGGVLLRDPVTGYLALLDPLAAAIVDLCDGTRPLRTVATDIAAGLGREPREIRREITETVMQLAAAGFIEWAATAATGTPPGVAEARA